MWLLRIVARRSRWCARESSQNLIHRSSTPAGSWGWAGNRLSSPAVGKSPPSFRLRSVFAPPRFCLRPFWIASLCRFPRTFHRASVHQANQLFYHEKAFGARLFDSLPTDLGRLDCLFEVLKSFLGHTSRPSTQNDARFVRIYIGLLNPP